MRAFACLAVGGVLLLAVSSHPAFINIRVVGAILIVRGAADLWASLGKERRAACTSRLAAALARGTEAFEAFTSGLARDDTARAPLTDLLEHRGGRADG